MNETNISPRTWFGTVTLSYGSHELIANRVRVRLRDNGIDFESLPEDEQFSERVAEIGKELTKFFKRVRKNSGATMRYMLVSEKHKSGLPHFHMLVHECKEVQITKRELHAAWTLGFTTWKLVKDKNAASYVTKYISKASDNKIRASLGYGKGYEGRGTAESDVPAPLKPRF